MTASDDLAYIAANVRGLPRGALIAITKQAKKIAADEGARAGSPLRGKKKSGMKLRAIDTLRDSGSTVTLRIQGVNPAGWVWVTTGTRPHRIRRRKRGKMAKMTVPHPGTAGRGAWRTVRARTVNEVIPKVLRDEVARAMRR